MALRNDRYIPWHRASESTPPHNLPHRSPPPCLSSPPPLVKMNNKPTTYTIQRGCILLLAERPCLPFSPGGALLSLSDRMINLTELPFANVPSSRSLSRASAAGIPQRSAERPAPRVAADAVYEKHEAHKRLRQQDLIFYELTYRFTPTALKQLGKHVALAYDDVLTRTVSLQGFAQTKV